MQVGQEQHPDDDEARKAQKRERVAVQATALSADKLEEIAQSLDHIKDVSQRVRARSMRKYVLETLQFSGERAVQAGESIGIGRLTPSAAPGWSPGAPQLASANPVAARAASAGWGGGKGRRGGRRDAPGNPLD